MCPERGHTQVHGRVHGFAGEVGAAEGARSSRRSSLCSVMKQFDKCTISRTCFLVKGGPIGKCLCGEVSPSPLGGPARRWQRCAGKGVRTHIGERRKPSLPFKSSTSD